MHCRTKHSTGQITTMISADCTRLDMAAGFFHIIWTGPIEIIIGDDYAQCFVRKLMFAQHSQPRIFCLGRSGRTHLWNSSSMSPLPILWCTHSDFESQQAVMVHRMIQARRSTVQLTDKRVRLLQEILQGIRVLVLFVSSRAGARLARFLYS
ncbi:ABC transporter transmembrane region domain-containing protein [Rhizoctonia solani AG-1 IA]|uniref:ABC transporter transmembrane region domain-containing protein n=1 Tax=Thanatephorus cucumeris (strain AG1-IA) TaxID=983506 RepID=L8WID2_THACA|nr:ABC transporter transmembrane region domain-containing protein [Rhizoctonia solani AG-1 IA]